MSPTTMIGSVASTRRAPRFRKISSTFISSDRKSTRLNSSHSQISYAVFCLKKKKEHVAKQPEANGVSDPGRLDAAQHLIRLPAPRPATPTHAPQFPLARLVTLPIGLAHAY